MTPSKKTIPIQFNRFFFIIIKVSGLMLESVAKRTEEEHEIALSVGPALRERILRDGRSATFGARPLRRTVQRLVEDVIAETFLDGFIGEGDDVCVDLPSAAAAADTAAFAAAGAAAPDRVLVRNVETGEEKVVTVAATAAGIEDSADVAAAVAAPAAAAAPLEPATPPQPLDVSTLTDPARDDLLAERDAKTSSAPVA
jgi:hypothetical protein